MKGFCVSNIDFIMVFSTPCIPTFLNLSGTFISVIGMFILPCASLNLETSGRSSFSDFATDLTTSSFVEICGEFIMPATIPFTTLSAIPTFPSINAFRNSRLGMSRRAGSTPPTDLEIMEGLPGSASETCEGPWRRLSLKRGQVGMFGTFSLYIREYDPTL